MATIDDKRTLEELNDTPSTRELYLIIQELVNKQDKMEQELKNLRKYTDKVKRKVDVVEWLNSNSCPSEFNSFRDLIKINRKELQYIFENGIINGIFNILQNNLPVETDNPIKAFNHKVGTLYVFQDKKWTPMNPEDFKKLIRRISQLIIHEFKDWTDEQRMNDKLKNYPYDEYVIRIFTNKIKEAEIKTKLYEYLKIPIKGITQIEC
jgi:hypothetical protein